MADPVRRAAAIVDVQFGADVTVVEPVNLYGCRIGSGSFIGPFVEIQRGAVVGANCRVQSHVFICDLVTIDDHCFIGHGVVFVNDPFRVGSPARGDRSQYRPTHVFEGVSIGSNATILPVRIAAGSVIGAGAVVTRDIEQPGIYAGNPARLIRKLPKEASQE